MRGYAGLGDPSSQRAVAVCAGVMRALQRHFGDAAGDGVIAETDA